MVIAPELDNVAAASELTLVAPPLAAVSRPPTATVTVPPAIAPPWRLRWLALATLTEPPAALVTVAFRTVSAPEPSASTREVLASALAIVRPPRRGVSMG